MSKFNFYEISVKDIIIFLKHNLFILTLSSVLGLVASATFIYFAEPEYQITAQIRLAQIKLHSVEGALKLVNIEDAKKIANRFKFPTIYNEKTINDCKEFDTELSSYHLTKKITIFPSRGDENLLEINFRTSNKQNAHDCLNAVIKQIQILQLHTAEEFLSDAREKLTEYRELSKTLNDEIKNVNNAGLPIELMGLRDERRIYLLEIIRLNRLIQQLNKVKVESVAPFYSPSNQVYPKKIMVVTLGLLSGFFLGLVFVMFRSANRIIYKNNASL